MFITKPKSIIKKKHNCDRWNSYYVSDQNYSSINQTYRYRCTTCKKIKKYCSYKDLRSLPHKKCRVHWSKLDKLYLCEFCNGTYKNDKKLLDKFCIILIPKPVRLAPM